VEAGADRASGQAGQVLGHGVAHHELAELDLAAQMDKLLLADERRRPSPDRGEEEVDARERTGEARAQALPFGRGGEVVGQPHGPGQVEPGPYVVAVLPAPAREE